MERSRLAEQHTERCFGYRYANASVALLFEKPEEEWMRIGIMLRVYNETGGIGVYTRNIVKELLESASLCQRKMAGRADREMICVRLRYRSSAALPSNIRL